MPEHMFTWFQDQPALTSLDSTRPAASRECLTTTSVAGRALKCATLPYHHWGIFADFEHAEAAFND
eukprot:15839785-Heterocapsa_arctica.AAC.1